MTDNNDDSSAERERYTASREEKEEEKMVDEESFARVRRNRREAERGDVWRECNAPYSLSYDTTMLKLRWLKLNAAARAESKTEAVSRSSRQKPEHVLQLSDVCLPCPLLIPPPPFIPFAPFLYLSFSFSTTSPILSLSLSLSTCLSTFSSFFNLPISVSLPSLTTVSVYLFIQSSIYLLSCSTSVSYPIHVSFRSYAALHPTLWRFTGISGYWHTHTHTHTHVNTGSSGTLEVRLASRCEWKEEVTWTIYQGGTFLELLLT